MHPMDVDSDLSIDLNADLGESYGHWVLGDDAALLPLLSSANVACGFHAGDPLTMIRTVGSAAALGVVVGAQVSYPDLVGFGRREMTVAPEQLEADVLYQLAALDGLCRTVGQRVRYLKPHGALYHRCARDPAQAVAVADAVAAYDPTLAVLSVAGGALAAAASRAGLRVVCEGFADRAYTSAGELVPRGEPGAVLETPEAVAAQALSLVRYGIAGQRFESICLHGDTPGAAEAARLVRARLEEAGIAVRAFA